VQLTTFEKIKKGVANWWSLDGDEAGTPPLGLGVCQSSVGEAPRTPVNRQSSSTGKLCHFGLAKLLWLNCNVGHLIDQLLLKVADCLTRFSAFKTEAFDI
jgi:hypothetical protein